MNITAIYPGTFDPITNGHSDIILRATKLFDHVILAVADSASILTLFTLDERITLARSALSGMSNVEVCGFDKLVTDFAKEKKAQVIIRGLRAVSDFDYEFQMAGMNRRLFEDAETVFLTPAENLSFISSSLVREIASLDGDVSQFVHVDVLTALLKKLNKN